MLDSWHMMKISIQLELKRFNLDLLTFLGDVISIRSDNIEVDETEKILRVVNLPSVKKIRVTSTVKKDIIRTAEVRTDQVYATSVTRHNYNNGEILYTTGFSQTAFNGSFFVKEVFGSREFTFTIRDTAVEEPAFLQSAISNVNIYAKHPTLTFTRGHAYVFDLADPSNFGYYLSFSQDNQYKLSIHSTILLEKAHWCSNNQHCTFC